MPHQPTRRRLLELTGATAVAALAGCLSSGSQPNGGGDGDVHDDTETEHQDDDHTDEGGDHHEEGDGHHEEGDGHHEEGDGQHEEGDGQHDDEYGHDHDEGMPEEPSPTAEVGLATEGRQHHFEPHLVWIEPGGTVSWRLESGSHDVVAYHPDNDRPLRMPEEATPWSTELLSEAGATFERTFETEGVYDYFCSPHESFGMVGTVIVGEPDPHEQSALEEPQSTLPEGARTELADLADNVNEVLGHTH